MLGARFTPAVVSNDIRDAHSYSKIETACRIKQPDSIAGVRSIRIGAYRNAHHVPLWQINADEISFDKLVGFFVSRFKKNAAITWKRDAMIVFPR